MLEVCDSDRVTVRPDRDEEPLALVESVPLRVCDIEAVRESCERVWEDVWDVVLLTDIVAESVLVAVRDEERDLLSDIVPVEV